MAATQTARRGAEPATNGTAPLPPCNLEAEEYVLGAMMISSTAIEAVRAVVQPRHFYRESHARIYRAALELHEQGSPVDVILLADELDTRGQLDEIGGKERIREIATLVPAATNAAHWAQKIVDTARLRQIIVAGEAIARQAWDREGSIDEVTARALEIAAALDTADTPALDVESWHRFESQAHDPIPVLVDGLWPEAAFGFIAAPPKKGKTWVALAFAIAVAAGRPLFGHYAVPHARPVLLVALEGHRAAIRARIGALARGMGLDPDGADLANLHFLYKPRGINLADPAWSQRLRRAAAQIDAALVIVDVLRAGARIKENDQADFTNLRHNLQPLSDDGRSIALAHHNVKLSEISKERDPGERMSGSGAMFGALDAAIYITGSEDHARRLRLSFDTRDIATPTDVSIALDGEGTGENGGYTYRDTAAWTIVEQPGVDEDDLKAAPAAIREWLEQQTDRAATTAELAYAFDCTDKTITRRRHGLEQLHVHPFSAAGKATVWRIVDPIDEPHDEQLDLESDPGHAPRTDTLDTCPTPTMSDLNASSQAKSADPGQTPDIERVLPMESGEMQGNPTPDSLDSPTGSARARAREAHPAPLELAETTIEDEDLDRWRTLADEDPPTTTERGDPDADLEL